MRDASSRGKCLTCEEPPPFSHHSPACPSPAVPSSRGSGLRLSHVSVCSAERHMGCRGHSPSWPGSACPPPSSVSVSKSLRCPACNRRPLSASPKCPPLSLPPAWRSLLPHCAPHKAAGRCGPGRRPLWPCLPAPGASHLLPLRPSSSSAPQSRSRFANVTPSPARSPGSTGHGQSLAFGLGDTWGEPQLKASDCGTPTQEWSVCFILLSAFPRA